MTKRKFLKYIGLFILSLVVLLIIITLSLRLAPVQNFVKEKVLNYVQEKIETPISLDYIYVNFPNKLELQNLYVEGPKKDTLLAINKLNVGLNLPQLLDNKAQFTSIDMEGVIANVKRNQEGKFNFDYILDAFTSDEKQSSESKPFIIDLDEIKLKKIHVNYDDRLTKNNLNLVFSDFETVIEKFDLDQNTYAIGDIFMKGLNFKLKQDLIQEAAQNIEESVDSASVGSPLNLSLKEIQLVDFNVDYQDDNSKTYAAIRFKELLTQIKDLNLPNNQYKVGKFKLANASIITNIEAANENQNTKDTTTTSGKNTPFLVHLDDLALEKIKFTYNNTASPHQPDGIDFNHLNFDYLDFKMSDFKMKDTDFQGTIEKGNFIEKSGFVLKEFQTQFTYNNTQLLLKDLLLKTQHSTLRDELLLTYKNSNELSSNLGNAQLKLNLDNAKIGFKDLHILAPEISNERIFQEYPTATLYVDSKVKGRIDDLTIEKLTASGLDNFKIIAHGNIKNVTTPHQLQFDVNIDRLAAQAKTIYNVTPKGSVPSEINLPREFVVKGNLKGTTNHILTDLNINSTDGNANIVGFVDLRQKNQEKYDLKLSTHYLNLGRIIKNHQVGKISLNSHMKGTGFNFSNANANINGNISHLTYNGYTYQDINLNGEFSNATYQLNLDSQDPNANLKMKANGVYAEKQPSIQLDGEIIQLDVQKLNFYTEPLILAGKIKGDFQNLNPNELNGNFKLSNFAISDTKDVYTLSEIQFSAQNTKDLNLLQLHSQFVDLNLEGKYKLTEIFNALENTLNQYYKFTETPKKPDSLITNQYFHLNAKIKDNKLIHKFIPELTSFQDILISGSFNAHQNKLELNADIPQIVYSGNTISSASLNIENPNHQLHYNFNVKEAQAGGVAIENLNLKGNIHNQNIFYTLSSKNKENEIVYLIDGQMEQTKDFIQLALKPEGLILNEKQWKVSPNNQIQIFEKGIVATNFELSNSNSLIRLESNDSSPNSSLNILIKNFEIEDLTRFMSRDTLIAEGKINADLTIRHLLSQPQYDGKLSINQLLFNTVPVGDLSVDLEQSNTQRLNAKLQLSGLDNDLQMNGYYDLNKSAFNFNLDIQKLTMESLQGFSFNEIKEGKGYLNGTLKINGTTSAPSINGIINFNDVGMYVTQLGTTFQNINDEIRFTPSGINFNEFTILDSDENTLVLDGKIKISTYQDFDFDLNLTSDKFKAVNAKRNKESLLFGVLSLDAELRITGDIDLPIISGNLDIDEPTDFTFILPSSSPSLAKRDGVVEFIDQDQVALNETIKSDSIDSSSRIKGMNVNVNISVKKEAKISIIIDQATGDFVEIQGDAELNGGIDPSGKTTLAGVYEVSDGAYQLNVNMLKRKFDIQKGSTITWNGDPLMADINITALYRIETAPIDLLEQQLAGRSGAELNIYKQKIPFNTLLLMKGELMKPEISFDITLDDSNPGVANEVIDNTKTKLAFLRNETNELNKQVFALLLLNRFVGENPFESNSGVSAQTMAKQSVSRILSEQLNNLAGELIEGVDLNFDLNSREDYSSGERQDRTDLNVSLSKTLLNDRLKVTVGNKFGVEGEARNNENMTNIAGDISLDYNLSRDGRYVLRAYRKNDYQVALQGQVIETGIGFIITIEYDKFKEIFQKSEKKKKRKKLKKNQ